MANVCSFEMRLRGTKEACFAVLNADFPSYYRGTCGEYGTEDDFVLCVVGECRYDLHSMDKGEETIREIARRLGVELEMFGYDISEPDWIQHFHYSSDGKVLHSFDLPTTVQDLEEFEIPESEHHKYTFNEDFEIYVLRPEHMEDFDWDEDEQVMNLPWRMTIPE